MALAYTLKGLSIWKGSLSPALRIDEEDVEIEWKVRRGDKEAGPVSFGKLQKLASAGKLKAKDEVRKADSEEWVVASSVAGLFADADEPLFAEDDGKAGWYYSRNRKKTGPISWGDLRQLAASGELIGTDLVWLSLIHI